MIEFLGAGVRRADGVWLFRRVCARIEPCSIVLIAGADPEGRDAALDIVSGHRIAAEGRVWVDRVPVMASTKRRVRGLVADVRRPAILERWTRRANSWGPSGVTRDNRVSLRLEIASAIMRGKTHVILPQLDAVLTAAELAGFGVHLRRLVHTAHISIITSLADTTSFRDLADQIVAIGEPCAR